MMEIFVFRKLYNLEKDPLESNNLYLQNSKKVQELSGLLDNLKKQGFSKHNQNVN